MIHEPSYISSTKQTSIQKCYALVRTFALPLWGSCKQQNPSLCANCKCVLARLTWVAVQEWKPPCVQVSICAACRAQARKGPEGIHLSELIFMVPAVRAVRSENLKASMGSICFPLQPKSKLNNTLQPLIMLHPFWVTFRPCAMNKQIVQQLNVFPF